MTNALVVVRGSHIIWQMVMSENGVATSLTGATLRFVARLTPPLATVVSDDNAAILRTSNPAAGITITDAANGKFELEFVKATTNTLEPTTYWWEVALLPTGASEYITDTGLQGTLLIKPDYGRGD